MSTITIRQGYEYRTFLSDIYKIKSNKKENPENNKEELYYPQYMQAAKCIDEITMRKNEYYVSLKQEQESARTFYHQRYYMDNEDIESLNYDYDEGYSNQRSKMGYPNNIIGFCAKRGQGKTSAMLAMVRALIEKESRSYKEKAIVEKFWNDAHRKNIALLENNSSNGEKSPVLDARYFALATIDPTTMEKRDSILEIIIARMLQKVQEVHQETLETDRRGTNGDTKNYREILKDFQDAFQKVRALKHSKPVDSFDDLSKISETDDNRSTKRAFIKLVENFLKCIGAQMMIIPVDDADLDPHRVYEVVEDLRKYCIVPGVIIMMAVHLDTLKTCIEQQYVKSYKYLLQTGYDTDHMKRYRCREMAERYVDKLIPDLHQIHLPYVDDKIRDGTPVKLVYETAKKEKGKGRKDLLAYPNVPDWYQDRLARLIYEKTGVILIEKPGYLHNFMPRRYRELTHMLSFFTRMTDIKISGMYSLEKLIKYQYFGIVDSIDEGFVDNIEEYLDRRIRNIDQLETYFFQHWCPVNLTKNQCDKLNKIRIAPMSIKNKRTIEVLKAYCVTEHAKEFFTEKNEKVFIDSDQIVTFADVLEALTEVKRRLDSPFKFDFVYAIQMYYTIYMNKIVSVCLKQKKPFTDLRRLTQGVITPYNRNYSVVERVDKDAKMAQPERWLIPCDPKGYLNKYDVDWWAEKRGKSLNISDHFRFDPFRYLLFQLDVLEEDFNKFVKYQNDPTKEEEKREISSKALNLAGIASEALQYICNYDLQYSVRKNVLEHVSDKELLTGMVADIYHRFIDVVNGIGINNQKVHSLPITARGIVNSKEEVYEEVYKEDFDKFNVYSGFLIELEQVKPKPTERGTKEPTEIENILARSDVSSFMTVFSSIATALEKKRNSSPNRALNRIAMALERANQVEEKAGTTPNSN